MEAYYFKEINCFQHCVDNGLLAAIAGAQPSVIGKTLTQSGFQMTRSLEDETLDNNDLAKIIVDSVLKHIERSPVDIKKFINVLNKSGYSRCEKFAAQMSNSMGLAKDPKKLSLPGRASGIPIPVVRLVRSDSAPLDIPLSPKSRKDSFKTRQGAKSTSGLSSPGSDKKYATQYGIQVDGGDGKQVPGSKLVTSKTDRVRSLTPEKKQHRRYSYKMNSDGNHGIALIMNNIEWQQDEKGKPLLSYRDGARQDGDALKISLEKIGYTAILTKNLTGDGMTKELERVRDECINKAHDSFICCILSHGGSNGIFGTDRKCIPVNRFSEILEPDKCPQLMHKPKIFFIQACRGTDVSMPIDGAGDSKMMSRVPRGADFYLSYATDPGHVALRSRYPQLLSNALLQDFCLDEMITKIHDELAKDAAKVETFNKETEEYETKEHLQIGQVVHSMRRAVYFT